MSSSPISIAIIDDDERSLTLLKNILNDDKFIITTFPKPSGFITSLESNTFDLLITDFYLNKVNGLTILKHLTESPYDCKVIVITESDKTQIAVEAMRNGASDYLVKPLQSDLLLEIIQKTMRLLNLERENNSIMQRLKKRESQITSQLKSAKSIQDYIIESSFPAKDKCDFASIYKPCDIISGDYFEFIRFREQNLLGVFVCDITGHGIPAALLVAMMKFITSETLRINIDPLQAIINLNEKLMTKFPIDKFASAFYGIIDFAKMNFTYVKACADPALLYNKTSKSFQQLDGETQLLALSHLRDEEPAFESYTVSIERGDRLFIFTDGLTEAQSPQSKHFEIEGIEKSLKKYETKSLHDQMQALYQDITLHCGGEQFHDDFTILGLHFL